jgi:hypothetical protein
VFSANVMSMDLGQLLTAMTGAGSDLKRVVAANQAGVVDWGMAAKAEQVATDMSTRAHGELPPPADLDALDRAERELGFALPPTLRRLYAEVANGGFGPGSGLLPIEGVVDAYRELGAATPIGRVWPERLLPIVHHDPWYDSVDAGSATERIVTWDPEELHERSSEADWQRSFSEVAPSLEAWLSEWVDSRPQQDLFAEEMAASQVEEARRSRARIAQMTPEERAAMGLPEVGWEQVVWGGLGLEDDQP